MIKDLVNGMKKVNIEAKVVEKGATREVTSRYKSKTYHVATIIIRDITAQIKLTLWDDQIEQVNVGDIVKVENGFVTAFRGEIQLNVGKYGKLTIS